MWKWHWGLRSLAEFAMLPVFKLSLKLHWKDMMPHLCMLSNVCKPRERMIGGWEASKSSDLDLKLELLQPSSWAWKLALKISLQKLAFKNWLWKIENDENDRGEGGGRKKRTHWWDNRNVKPTRTVHLDSWGGETGKVRWWDRKIRKIRKSKYLQASSLYRETVQAKHRMS